MRGGGKSLSYPQNNRMKSSQRNRSHALRRTTLQIHCPFNPTTKQEDKGFLNGHHGKANGCSPPKIAFILCSSFFSFRLQWRQTSRPSSGPFLFSYPYVSFCSGFCSSLLNFDSNRKLFEVFLLLRPQNQWKLNWVSP